MMRTTFSIMAFLLAACVAAAVLPGVLSAEGERQSTDFRDRPYTEEDLANALFPEAGSQETVRGIQPQETHLPPPSGERSVQFNVFFEFNSAMIRPEYYPDLDKLGRVLTQPQYVEKRVEIEGHTDKVGSDAYNQRLSERRAQSVRQYLAERFSIGEHRLLVRGHGETHSIATNATDEGRSKNRRIEVVNPGR